MVTVVGAVVGASACGGRIDPLDGDGALAGSGGSAAGPEGVGGKRPSGVAGRGPMGTAGRGPMSAGGSVGVGGSTGSGGKTGTGGAVSTGGAGGGIGGGGANGMSTSGAAGMPDEPAEGGYGAGPNPDPTDPPITSQPFEPMGSAGDSGVSGEEQEPPTCGEEQCNIGEICRPGVGCEAACDVRGGIDDEAAWPLGGGCPTRRGLSRFAGATTPRKLWVLDTGGYPPLYSSALTVGSNHVAYAPYYDAYQSSSGFLQLGVGGWPVRRFEDWLSQCPIVAAGGVLYTVPGGLRATRSNDGQLLWEAEGPWNQSGEPSVGSDGTVYVGGIVGGEPALVAVKSNGELAWSHPTNDNFALNTWSAVSVDGTVYYDDKHLRALSPEGELLWSSSATWTHFPTVDPDGNVYVGAEHDYWSFSGNGQVRWSVPGRKDANFHFQQAAIGPDRTVYVSYRTYLNDNGNTPESGILAYTADGALKWKFARAAFGTSAPVVDREGRIYLGIESVVYAITPDGQELWRDETPDNFVTAIAIDSDGTTLVAAMGRLIAYRDAP